LELPKEISGHPKMRLSLLLFFLITSCGFAPEPLYERDEPLGRPKPNAVEESKAQASFAEIDRTVIQPHCIQCHDSQTAKGGVDLSSLAAAQRKPGVLRFGDPDGSLFYTTILEGSMPDRAEPLDLELAEKVRLWILEN
jgi:hypothetical protein